MGRDERLSHSLKDVYDRRGSYSEAEFIETITAAFHSAGYRQRKRRVEYDSWSAMLRRCGNPLNPSYVNYGGRGIGVCYGYLSFDNFLHNVGYRPEGYSLERIDNEAGYTCGQCAECEASNRRQNVRWASRQDQNLNRRWHSNNTTGFKGVRFTHGRWAAQITYNGKALYLGRFDTALDAAKAYNTAAKRFHGGKAHLNPV